MKRLPGTHGLIPFREYFTHKEKFKVRAITYPGKFCGIIVDTH